MKEKDDFALDFKKFRKLQAERETLNAFDT